MTRTIVTKDDGLPENSSLAYGTLDNRGPYEIPLPECSRSVAMGAAGGLLSTVNDLIKYYKALMRSWQSQARESPDKSAVFGDVPWLLAPLQIMEVPAFREKSYAAGWARSQLPTTVGDLGVNPGLVDEMPLLAAGIDSRLALWHQGSLVGSTSFVLLLPETESAVVVLTNTMALNDAADWIGQLQVETLLDSPAHARNDYVKLASSSADRALQRYSEVEMQVEEGRQSGGPSRSLSEYVGSFVGFGGVFRIEVVETEDGLAVLFQGRETQRYQLRHHHGDTFTWLMSWNEQIKRARFIITNPAFYSIRFKAGPEGITALNWVHDASIEEGDDFIKQ
ncbi:hypothetical protein ACJZ2D_007522 [Fusarium nematophilum]